MKFKIRRDTTANWVSANPVLADGEIATELMAAGVKKLKVGDGSTAWNDLGYASGGEKGDTGNTGNTGNTGPMGPGFSETVYPITVEPYLGSTTAQVRHTPSNLMSFNTMYYLDGFAAHYTAGGLPVGSVDIFVPATSPGANKVGYVNLLVMNDSAYDLIPTANIDVLGPAPVIAPSDYAILNIAVIDKGGVLIITGTWVGR